MIVDGTDDLSILCMQLIHQSLVGGSSTLGYRTYRTVSIDDCVKYEEKGETETKQKYL
jgi:hypothetical protein